ncbi:MAG TPA: Chromate resistance protein ChrB [Candidatus Dormibacteraeota bacterium]|nr:Chromate resistance protein ChrB [Candidatus Dormibacteraeota bacterium]
MNRRLHPTFILLVYRMPAKPTAGRVAVWRMLKKMGAIYIQQSVCAFPDNPRIRRELVEVRKKIMEAGGEFHFLPTHRLTGEERQKLVDHFLDQTAKHYREIIENCEVNFQSEIDFEIARKNFTYEEAEEIRTEYEKIVEWFRRTKARDWFASPLRAEAEGWIARCERLVEDFEARVFTAQEPDQAGVGSPKTLPKAGQEILEVFAATAENHEGAAGR